MSEPSSVRQPTRIAAVLAYLPVVGWLYVLLFQRGNKLAVYHFKQSFGLVLFLAAVTVGWIVIAWVVAWIPYAFVVSIALFTLVIAAYLFGFVAWVLGIVNAVNARPLPLPLFGEWASHLPIY
jgi:uncharacterized membrane protein